ncbi:uncharacterized protein T551_03503 [Pneumocystis jirovecii RU7]|uniref:Uncharacterized protein n=2 Tax=Pneumocystis jirovecii TaxID=42068 RepID=A0A0W4ZE19_PNEJ7|nr:uncharacterized protein T551_03503 [Pneumocystis jirovecii RU7]KTW26586.1 hypothetical protein T551_03503 [Pneumocystis jirovecii RU7]
MEKVEISFDLKESNLKKSTEIVNKKKIKNGVSFLNLFDFTKKRDTFLLFFACIISFINGLFAPCMTFLLGRLFHVFSLISLKEITEKEFRNQVNHYILLFAILAVVSFIGGWLFQTLWYIFAEIQIIRVNKQLFHNFASKEIKWYDLRYGGIAGIINRCERNIGNFHYTLSNTLGKILSSIITFSVSLFLAFWYSWKLTFVILVSLPIIILIAGITSYFIQPYISREKETISQAAALVDQAVVNIPIVKIFNGQYYESQKFNKCILKSSHIVYCWKRIYALQQSLVRFFILAMFVQGFWYGSYLIIKKEISTGNVLTVFWACLMVSFSIQTIVQHLVFIDQGKISSADLQNLFKDEKTQKKDNKLSSHFSPEKCDGNITYDSVSFAYPSRPEKIILKNVSLFFPAGKTTFVVGASGSGKSTLAALLIRIYEINNGSIYIDNKNIELLDINWIRNNVTLVQQPVIFNESLKLNITIGKSSPTSVDISEIKNASRMAMLEEIIFELSDGYDTKLGTNGLSLSSGQMQRVAMARARLRDTSILILDESTSSLDYINRSLIYDAVKFWRKNKTTIIITHDISQIEDSDYVYVIDDGSLVQKGLKKTLLEDKNGLFFNIHLENEKTKNSLSSQKKEDISSKNESNNSLVESSFNNKPHIKSAAFNFLKTNLSIETLLLNSANVIVENRKNTTNIRTLLSSNMNHSKISKKFNFRKKYFLLNISLWNLLRNNWKYVNKKIFLVLGLFFCLGNGIATPLFSYALSKLLALFFSPKNASEITKKSLKSSLFVLGVSFLDSLTLYLKIFFFQLSSDYMVTNIRSKLYKNVLFQDMFYFSEKECSSKNITRIIINETELIRSIFEGIAGNILIAIVMASLGIIWSFFIAWKLTIITVGMLPFLYISIQYYSYINNIWEQKYKEENINASSILYEFTENTFTIKALLLNDFFEQKYMLSIKKVFMKGIRRAIYIGFGYGFMECSIFSFKTLLFFYGSKFILKKIYTPIDILTVFSLIIFSIITASQFLSMIPHYNKIKQASDDINSLFNVSGKTTENEGSLTVPLNGEIIFKNVTFSYPGHCNEVLQNIDLKIENYEKIVLTGLSGSGKSTMISLIQKLYQVQKGIITINGYNISSIETKWLRNHIAVVRQTPMLFNMTIEQNIAYGLDSFNRSHVQKAAQKANIHDFIMKLTDGYDTMLGDYGKGLSTGQAQRISLARAFIRNPKILILDECTSALDPLCALSIQEIIKNITNITVIIITHSKEMMKLADRIILLKNGQIIETGTYDELIDLKKNFWTLIQKGEWT